MEVPRQGLPPPDAGRRSAPARRRHRRCDDVVKDGDAVTANCTARSTPTSRAGMAGANRKVKGTIHWVCAHACRGGRSSPVRPPVHACRIRTTTKAAARPTATTSIRDRCRSCSGFVEPAAADCRAGDRASSSSAWAISSPTATTTRRQAGVQPQRDAARYLGRARPDADDLPAGPPDPAGLDPRRSGCAARCMPPMPIKMALAIQLSRRMCDAQQRRTVRRGGVHRIGPAASASASTAWCRSNCSVAHAEDDGARHQRSSAPSSSA